jgi:SAM-dependent methyltransferase
VIRTIAPFDRNVSDEARPPFTCPACGGSLETSCGPVPNSPLSCTTCKATYAREQGVHVLIPKSAFTDYPIAQVKHTYDRAYCHDGIMGTQFDPDYSRVTKTTLLELCSATREGRILDLGTGDGHLWDFAAEGLEAHAIDLSSMAVRRAVDRHPHLIAAAALSEHLPYPDGYFAGVVAADTLEHTFDLARSLREIQRVLQPGGILAFSVPAENSLRKWGRNHLLRSLPSPGFLWRLAGVVVRRWVLFGRPDFQPIDRDLPMGEWHQLVESAGLRVETVREWPRRPLEPMVFLLSARKTA